MGAKLEAQRRRVERGAVEKRRKTAWKNECKNGGILQQSIQERCRSSQHTEEEGIQK